MISATVPAYSVAVNDDTKQVIINKAQDSIESNYDPEEYRFSLSPRWIPGSLLSVEPSAIRSVRQQGAIEQYTNFKVLYMKGNEIEQVQIQLKVESEQKLPVLNQRMRKGEIIKIEDLSWYWVSIRIGIDKPVKKMDQIVGKTLRRMVNAGEPIVNSQISTPFLVEAGDDVDLIFSEYGIEIVLTCKARQDGAMNEEIQIYCKENRNKYLGKVSSPGETLWQKTH